MVRAAMKVSGAGAIITADGERSGRHMEGEFQAAMSGACAKTQTPTSCEPVHSGGMLDDA
jgi:hypothetical protein